LQELCRGLCRGQKGGKTQGDRLRMFRPKPNSGRKEEKKGKGNETGRNKGSIDLGNEALKDPGAEEIDVEGRGAEIQKTTTGARGGPVANALAECLQGNELSDEVGKEPGRVSKEADE